LTTSEALAIARLRQWAALRISVNNGKTRNPKSHGWQRRDERTYDASQVRVIDFEAALATLPMQEQIALVLRYRDREPDSATAQILACSLRKLGNVIPQARAHLANALDRRNLL
jgi:DNA-directed RNA polymerase specialized sigma24 family protein